MGGARQLHAVAVLAVSAAFLSACGGDNDPSAEPPTTTPPEPAETKPQSPAEKSFPTAFAQKVDPICVKAEQQIDKVAGTRARSRPAVQKLASIYEGAASDL